MTDALQKTWDARDTHAFIIDVRPPVRVVVFVHRIIIKKHVRHSSATGKVRGVSQGAV
jgi:hypothetical protein